MYTFHSDTINALYTVAIIYCNKYKLAYNIIYHVDIKTILIVYSSYISAMASSYSHVSMSKLAVPFDGHYLFSLSVRQLGITLGMFM